MRVVGREGEPEQALLPATGLHEPADVQERTRPGVPAHEQHDLATALHHEHAARISRRPGWQSLIRREFQRETEYPRDPGLIDNGRVEKLREPFCQAIHR